MIGFFFGREGAELFGVLTPAAGGRRAVRGALLLAPFGQEMIRSHRSFRILADRLAAAGVPSLRFDYGGTGDSWGTAEIQTVEGWTADASSAIDELLEGADVRRVVLIGQRLGAMAALRLAAARAEVDRLVLWDPIFEPPVEATDQPVELDGFLVTPAFNASVRTTEVATLAARVRAAVLVLGDHPVIHPSWQRESIDEPPSWEGGSYLGAGRLPAKTLARIVEFCR